MPVGGRTVNLGNVIFGLGVNTQGLQRATADLQAFSRATDRVARVGTTASLALANSMARMERQAASALQSVLNLDARIRRAGAPPQLLAANTREFQRLSPFHLFYYDGNFSESGLLSRPPATFSDDQFIALIRPSDEEGFENPFLSDGLGQFLEFWFVKMLAGLRGIGDDFFNPTIEEGL